MRINLSGAKIDKIYYQVLFSDNMTFQKLFFDWNAYFVESTHVHTHGLQGCIRIADSFSLSICYRYTRATEHTQNSTRAVGVDSNKTHLYSVDAWLL